MECGAGSILLRAQSVIQIPMMERQNAGISCNFLMLVGFGLNTSLSSACLVLKEADHYGLEKQMSFYEIFGLGLISR